MRAESVNTRALALHHLVDPVDRGLSVRPEFSVMTGQNGSLTFSLEGHQLQPQRGIFDGDGLVTAEEESDEPDNGEKEFGHLQMFASTLFTINSLHLDGIMANHTA